ncbi:MAG: lytic murein transglycosylase B [Neisseria sp.]|nr:lytic murein transglycosylase B [Neisseria sp.]
MTKINQHFASVALAALLAACATEVPQNAVKAPVVAKETASKQRPVFNQNAESIAITGFSGNVNVQQFVDYEAQTGAFSRNELANFFAGANHKPNIITIMNRPGTSRPWYEFQKGNSGAAKINAGKAFYAQHRHVIDQVAREYGVPAEIIVAIVGIETNYGKNMGSFRLADALPTLAFDYPRRSEFFQNELRELLLMSKEESQDPYSFLGSYAGAMGMPQFMPSSYRKWAVDYDRDGKRNIWGSVPDVAASVANYMKAHGWQTGGKVLMPVVMEINPRLQAIIDEKTELKYTVGELKQLGVIPMGEVADHERAILFSLETSPGQREYFIGLNNFYTIWQYNHSRMYVTAVRDIANGVGRGGL